MTRTLNATGSLALCTSGIGISRLRSFIHARAAPCWLVSYRMAKGSAMCVAQSVSMLWIETKFNEGLIYSNLFLAGDAACAAARA